jgi:hypothetical protein
MLPVKGGHFQGKRFAPPEKSAFTPKHVLAAMQKKRKKFLVSGLWF